MRDLRCVTSELLGLYVATTAILYYMTRPLQVYTYVPLQKELTALPTSTLSMMCITYVGITMFIKMVIYQHSHGPVNRASIVPEDPRGLLITVSYCSLSFVCHFNLLPLQKELHRPTKRRMSIIVVFSMLLAYTLYNLVIFSGVFRVGLIGC